MSCATICNAQQKKKTKKNVKMCIVYSPMFTMPWLVSSQHECNLNMLRL